jgi:acetate kinase
MTIIEHDRPTDRLMETVLALNGGSSSIKFAVYQMSDPPTRQLHGKVDGIGQHGTTLTFEDSARKERDSRSIGALDQSGAAAFLIDWLGQRIALSSISAAGDRVVNGGPNYNEPQTHHSGSAR